MEGNRSQGFSWALEGRTCCSMNAVNGGDFAIENPTPQVSGRRELKIPEIW